jgi:NADH-quinone oxidoreductase subunit J
MALAIAFYLLAAVTVGAGFGVISSRNPVHSVLFLILSFFSAAGLFVTLGAEFLAMLLVVVYVGAVAVLFLFVVMMLDVDFAKLRSGFTRNLPFGLLIALVLLAEIVVAVSAWKTGPVLADAPAAAVQPNIVAIGELLYSRYLMPFELAGLILLVAMIGAIVLTHRSRPDARNQDATKQIGRKPREAVKNMNPGIGEGMSL